MAPKKKSKVIISDGDECTPVKACTSKTTNLQDAISFGEYELNEESPEAFASPHTKPSNIDIEWAWKSPVGRLNGGLGNNTKRRLIDKTPIQKAKRCLKSNSPLTNLPSKRKLIKHDSREPDRLSELSLQWGALLNDSVLKKDQAATASGEECYRDEKGKVPESITNEEDNSYSSMFNDGNVFALINCSQLIEEKLTQNPDKVVFSPIQVNTPCRGQLRRPTSSTPKYQKHPIKTTAPLSPKDQINNVNLHLMEPPKTFSKLGSHDINKLNYSIKNKPMLSKRSLSLSACVVNNNISTKKENKFCEQNVGKIVQAKICDPFETKINADLANKNTLADDSFDAVLLTLCDEQIELLSQTATNSSQPSPSEIITRYSKPNQNKFASDNITILEATLKCSNISDKDFLQPDFLNMLDTIESNSVKSAPTQSSQQQQCTPEEIERKRLQAKMKLEMLKSTAHTKTKTGSTLTCTPKEIEEKRNKAKLKLELRQKAALLDGVNRLPNPFLQGKYK